MGFDVWVLFVFCDLGFGISKCFGKRLRTLLPLSGFWAYSFKITILNFQISNNLQFSNYNYQTVFLLGFDVWVLFVFCDLSFGISKCFGKRLRTLLPLSGFWAFSFKITILNFQISNKFQFPNNNSQTVFLFGFDIWVLFVFLWFGFWDFNVIWKEVGGSAKGIPSEDSSRAYNLKLQFSISKYQIISNFQITILKLFFFWYLEFEYYFFLWFGFWDFNVIWKEVGGSAKGIPSEDSSRAYWFKFTILNIQISNNFQFSNNNSQTVFLLGFDIWVLFVFLWFEFWDFKVFWKEVEGSPAGGVIPGVLI